MRLREALSIVSQSLNRDDVLKASLQVYRSPRRFRVSPLLLEDARSRGLRLSREIRAPTTREVLGEFSLSRPLMKDKREVIPHPPVEFVPSTASVLPCGERLLVALKSVNYHMENGKYILHQQKVSHRCHVFFLEKGEVVKSQEMTDTRFQRGSARAEGLSDVRFLWTDGKEEFWGIGDTQSLLIEESIKNDVPRLCLLRGKIGQDAWLEVHPLASSIEKNWLHLPIETLPCQGRSFPLPRLTGEESGESLISREFFLVKRLNPLTICRVVGNALTEVISPGDPNLPHDLRGSAGFISYELAGEEGFLGLAHQVVFGEGNWTRIYAHRFIFLKKDLSSLRCGHRFFFEKVGVEFCLSMFKRGEEVSLSYSVEDQGPFLGKVSVEEVSLMF